MSIRQKCSCEPCEEKRVQERVLGAKRKREASKRKREVRLAN